MVPQTLGRISSYYYLTHVTMRMFQSELGAESTIPELIEVLSVRIWYSQTCIGFISYSHFSYDFFMLTKKFRRAHILAVWSVCHSVTLLIVRAVTWPWLMGFQDFWEQNIHLGVLCAYKQSVWPSRVKVTLGGQLAAILLARPFLGFVSLTEFSHACRVSRIKDVTWI